MTKKKNINSEKKTAGSNQNSATIPFKDCYNIIAVYCKDRINADQVHALWNSNKFPHYAFREFFTYVI